MFGKGIIRLPLWMNVTGTAALCIYVWLLPFLARWTDKNSDRELCKTMVQCSNGQNFAELTGSEIGCGCGEGIFGQSACPVGDYGYTISGYIVTPPATALMAILSALPILSMWQLGSAEPPSGLTIPAPSSLLALNFLSMAAFQLFYVLFLICTYCIFNVAHEVVVIAFVVAGVIHYGTIAFLQVSYYHDRAGAALITLLASIAVAGFLGLAIAGAMFQDGRYNAAYWPWACECIALTAGFSIAPLVMWIDGTGKSNLLTASTVL